jgi:hypothetical protein
MPLLHNYFEFYTANLNGGKKTLKGSLVPICICLGSTTLYGIPKDKYPCHGEKAGKNKNW